MLLRLVAPAVLLARVFFNILTSGGAEALLAAAPGILQGFGIIAATAAALLAFAGTLFSIFTPGGVIERSY